MRIDDNEKSYKVGWLELAALVGVLLAILAANANAARVKDMATLEGVSEQQLVGYGLVVGLAGTGDGARTQFTVQSVANMLQKMGIVVNPADLRLRNVAAVMVTANLPAFVKPGKKIDVSIASLGDARSLEGGTLLVTPLQASDGEYYAQAQGAISIGGFSANAGKRNSAKKGHTLAGNVPDGAVVYKEIESANLKTGTLRWILANPDFTSAVAMANAINQVFPNSAIAEDASTVLVTVPESMKSDYMSFIARAEVAEFNPNTNSRVVLNEKTGTIVSGANVQIDEVAVSHGSITVQVANTQTAPPTFIGQATLINNQQLSVQEPRTETRVMPAVSNAGQLAQALNSLGVSPRDIISIFQAIKKAGALHAELVIM